MGVASSQLRLAMLTSYRSDLEFAIQMICQKKMTLAYQAQGAAENYPDIAAAYHTLDQKLELEMQSLETQSKAVNTEIETVKSTIDNDIKSTFSYKLTV